MFRGRRQLVILFISILAISLATLLIELGVFMYSSYKMNQKWPRFVAADYVASVETALEESDAVSPAIMIQQILEQARDKVSGLIMRDDTGYASLFYGKLFNEKEPPAFLFSVDANTSEEYEVHEISSDIFSTTPLSPSEHEVTGTFNIYEFHVDSDLDGSYYFTTDGPYDMKQTIVLPDNIQKRDVAGCVLIYSDGEFKGSFDIIAFNVASYPATRFVLDSFLVAIAFAVVFALLVAVFFSWQISKRNENSIKDIEGALQSLSEGDYDISIRRKGVDELDAISSSIETLASRLDANERARYEWLRSISHDLNTPVSALTMLIDGAADRVFPVNDDLFKALRKETETLASRVASVKSYFSLLTMKEANNLSSANLMNVVKALSPELRRQVVIEGDEKAEAMLDFSLALNALVEIVRNALMYGSEVRVVVEANIIKVIDKGTLPEGYTSFFEPWSRGDESRHSGGSGLGLPIAGRAMELMGGKASITSEGEEVIASLVFRS